MREFYNNFSENVYFEFDFQSIFEKFNGKIQVKNKMTNSKEIDEIVGEMDQYESLSNSEASFDLAPTIQKEIKQLADSLR